MGLKAAVIASSCCSIPLAIVLIFSAIGAGSMTAALKIPKYKMYFFALGTTFILYSLYLAIKRKSATGTCRIDDVKNESRLVAVSLVTYVALTLLLIYLILPVVSGWLFG